MCCVESVKARGRRQRRIRLLGLEGCGSSYHGDPRSELVEEEEARTVLPNLAAVEMGWTHNADRTSHEGVADQADRWSRSGALTAVIT